MLKQTVGRQTVRQSPRPLVASPSRLLTFQALQRRRISSTELNGLGKREAPSPAPTSVVAQATPSEDTGKSNVRPSLLPDGVKEKLRSWTLKNASTVRQRMDAFSSAAQTTFSQIGGRLNEVTGYHEIEMLKKQVVNNEQKMHEVREAARTAKGTYEEAVTRRSNSQREVNDLLQRKSSWTDADVSRFTLLVRQDHLYEQEEARAKVTAMQADDAVELQFNELMRSILSRYHEEQVWSDKIRSASTYGSLAALGLNLAVFILAIVLVEPWKRKRLVQSFEKRVIELNERNQEFMEGGLNDLRIHQAAQEELLADIRVAQAKVATALLRDDSKNSNLTESAHPALEMERSAKSARDRQIAVISVAGALSAGAIGWLLGSRFG